MNCHPAGLVQPAPPAPRPQAGPQLLVASSEALECRQPPILKRIDAVPGYLGGFTAAAVVDAPAAEVLRFLSSPADWPSVYSSTERIEDLKHSGGWTSFNMWNVVSVLGRTKSSRHSMRLQADPSTGQVRFCQAEPTGMIKDMEGVNVVLPLPPGADPVAQLERATQELLHSLGVVQATPPAAAAPAAPAQAAAEPPLASLSFSLPSLADLGLGLPALCPQRCVVVMYHRVQMRGPAGLPGVGSLIRGPLMSAHTRNLEDLLTRFG
ncbi:cyclase [Micractinium conductrix]|uniref:Cyclase n=1 Tax=Micractinium conductrix TaxID=554055 RepID=A0A2P6V6E9_9CHLO|nr:cyclase [Micractinium conductrix]|eukprot:PSC69666.1 cyclase [Micractinium conductrix]